MSQITRRRFLLRLRELAKIALHQYGLDDAKLKFVNYSGNGLYQVTIPSGKPVPEGKYALRLHQPNYMRPDYIESEMEWLAALNEVSINIPRPIRNQSDVWITIADGGYDVPQKRNCTLIGWTEGRIIGEKAKPKHFKALGKVVGRLHEQSKKWKPPRRFNRPHWDWEGLYGEGISYGATAVDAREAIPKKHQPLFNDILKRVEEAIDQLGKGKSVYGLIHADLGIADNVAFKAGVAKPFDFDDCGFGYWMFDLAVPVIQHHMDTQANLKSIQEAMYSGYMESSSLDNIGSEYLDLFMAARLAQFMFFYQASALAYPELADESRQEIEECAKYLKQISNRMN